jgi:hypothetical protein
MEAAKAAHQWCTQFQAAVDKGDESAVAELFTDDGWWRDMLTLNFDFNSYKSEWSALSIAYECQNTEDSPVYPRLFLGDGIVDGLKKHGMPPIKNLKVVRPNDASIVPVNDNLTWAQ